MISHLVSMSGGLASAEAARRVIDRYGHDGVALLFADTKYEDADLYRFLGDMERVLAHPIIRIAEGRTPWQVFRDERFIGNSRIDPCSKILKRRLLAAWRREHAPQATWQVGIRWDEAHRLDRLQKRDVAIKWDSPLLWKPWATTPAIIIWLESKGIEIPLLYRLGFGTNNCGGRCVKQGQKWWAHLLRVRRSSYLEVEAEESTLGSELGGVTILKETRQGVRRPLSLRVLRERLERDPTLFDESDCAVGCGCALDDFEDAAEEAGVA